MLVYLYFIQDEASRWSKHSVLPSVKVSKTIPQISAGGGFVNIFKVKEKDTETPKNTTDKLIDSLDIGDFDFRTLTRSSNNWGSRRNVSFADDSAIADNLKHRKSTALRNIFQSPCRSTMLKRSKTQLVPSLKQSSSTRNVNMSQLLAADVFENLRLSLRTSKRHMQHTWTKNKQMKRSNTYPNAR